MPTPTSPPSSPSSSPFDEKRLKERFSKLDINHDGTVSREELKQVIKDFRLPFNEGDDVKIFQKIDKDGNGVIDFNVSDDLPLPALLFTFSLRLPLFLFSSLSLFLVLPFSIPLFTLSICPKGIQEFSSPSAY
jgi:hypothetical protein